MKENTIVYCLWDNSDREPRLLGIFASEQSAQQWLDGEYVIPKRSVGEIIGRPLEFGGVWRIPVCFHDAPNFPSLYNGDPAHPRIIGSGHYVNANILTNYVESRDFEPVEFSGVEKLLNCIYGE